MLRLNPLHIGEVLTVRKRLVLGIYAECVAEHASVGECVLDAECHLIALSGNCLKRINSLELALVVLIAEYNEFYAKILSKTVGGKLDRKSVV